MEVDRQEVLLPGPVPRSNLVWPGNLGCFVCIGALVTTHLILMAVLVGSLASVAPEVKTTLDDVRLMVPQMHRTLTELGVMIPEIQTGMKILQQLCHSDSQCHV